ncbi:hypothetical protein L6R52_33770 [Myxococcota bacterium]|nr:hypothetical protein [Myxococcota bacterium]
MADERGPGPAPHGVIDVEQADAPPPLQTPELSPEALAKIVDDGDVNAVEAALREHVVRLPDVLDQLQRVLELGHGNLAAVLVTMLIGSFRIARADRLAEQVLQHRDTAGDEELVDLAAALLGQERLTIATKVLDAVLARDAANGRALYLRARILARRGKIDEAFDTIARVSPKLLDAAGMAVQARYALFAGRAKAMDGALRHAKKGDDPDVVVMVRELERIQERMSRAPALTAKLRTDLRAAIALEYGSVLVELAEDPSDGGRFGMDAVAVRDVGRLVDRMLRAIDAAKLPITELLHATEDGEIIAAALSHRTGKPYRQWRADRPPAEGSWLCMASAATHPHLPNTVVQTIQSALDEGTVRTLAIVLPVGWRGPIVPDVIGRLTGDDELPWAIDDEVDETVERIFGDDEPTTGVARDDEPELFALVDAARVILRATQPLPRAAHVPFLDETPVPRG